MPDRERSTAPYASSSMTKRFLSIAGFLCLLSGAVLYGRVDETPFHGDESGWISSGRYYADLVLVGDFRWERWICLECDTYGSLSMPLGKLLIGLPLGIGSPEAGPAFSAYYDFQRSFEENRTAGMVPPPSLLLRARRASAAFGVLCCVLVFAVGYASHGAWTGLTAAVLLLTNRLFLDTATQALTDIHYNVFLLGVALACILLFKARGARHVALAGACAGIVAGLACLVKVTGIVIGAALIAVVVLYAALMRQVNRREIVLSLALFSGLSLSVIYLGNPFFWPSLRILDGKALIAETGSLAREIGGIREGLATGTLKRSDVKERYPQLCNLSHLLEFPHLFLRWNRLMEEERTMESASWHGNRLVSLHRQLLFRHSSFPFEWIVLGIGIATCWKGVRASWGRREVAVVAVALSLFAINYGFILAVLKLNWDRYYLPTVIASQVVTAIGIHAAATGASGWFARWRARVAPRT
jgi:4-amino-4-deoxy-L-arabinose transferase-like glycosyltransferase